MPREFPEDALEAIAVDCDLTAKDWWGEGNNPKRRDVAAKWRAKAVAIRQAIDAYREQVNAPPISRRGRLTALVDGLAEKMDFRKAAAGDR